MDGISLLRKLIHLSLISMLLAACSTIAHAANPSSGISTQAAAIPTQVAAIPTTIGTIVAAPKNLIKPPVPAFDHIILIVFENRNYDEVIGNSQMPYFNQLASQNVLLTQSYAVTHPSLPNYIALVSGSTYGITSDCLDCFLNQTNLADTIQSSGRTWRSYVESMPSPCTLGNSGNYAQRHSPFIYFDDIRNNASRCDRNIVSTDQLSQDLKNLALPNFALIVPNVCNDAHDCAAPVADQWLKGMMDQLQKSGALGDNYLIAITFDETRGDNSSCCGMGKSAGGHVATILVSPKAKSGFQDSTAYSHYSLLKTIEYAWGLPLLGMSASSSTPVITAPWK
jgi:phospholipase C